LFRCFVNCAARFFSSAGETSSTWVLGPIQNFLRAPIQHGRMFKGMFGVFVRIGAVTALGQA